MLPGVIVWDRNRRTFKRWWKAWRAKPKRERHLHAGSPNDCQDCRLAGAEQGAERTKADQTWREVKSRRR